MGCIQQRKCRSLSSYSEGPVLKVVMSSTACLLGVKMAHHRLTPSVLSLATHRVNTPWRCASKVSRSSRVGLYACIWCEMWHDDGSGTAYR
jgi:hypothetical protein